MTREELLRQPEYWETKAQIELYDRASKFMQEHGMNRTKLAEHLGVSKGYVTQLLNGDYDHRMSKFFELALQFGYVPQIDFKPIEEIINNDNKWAPSSTFVFDVTSINNTFESVPLKMEVNAA